MIGSKIHFKGVICKIIPQLSLVPLLIWSTGKQYFIEFTEGPRVAQWVEGWPTDLAIY